MSLHRRNARRDRNEKLLIDYFTKAGALVYRLSGADLPDLLLGHRGRWLLVEVKSPKGRLKPGQQQFHATANALGLPCYTVYTLDQAREVIYASAPKNPDRYGSGRDGADPFVSIGGGFGTGAAPARRTPATSAVKDLSGHPRRSQRVGRGGR